jgi:flagellin-like protein
MSIKNMLKSKKAISPILATLLLIVIAVAAIVVTYAWIMTYMGSTTQQASVILYNENVRFYQSGGANNRTEIVIGNSGTGDTHIVRLYLGTSSNNLVEITANTNITSSGIPLSAGSTAAIRVDWPNNAVSGNWTAGETYYFKVVPQQGQAFPFPQQAPQ